MADRLRVRKLHFALLHSDYANLDDGLRSSSLYFSYLFCLLFSQCLLAPSIAICVDLLNHRTTASTGISILEEHHLLVQGQARMFLVMVNIFF